MKGLISIFLIFYFGSKLISSYAEKQVQAKINMICKNSTQIEGKKFCYMKKNNINEKCYYVDAINDLDTIENLKDLNISIKYSNLKKYILRLIVCNNKIKKVIPQKN